MKILLTAINAKYIHSNPAVYSLKAFAGERFKDNVEIAEYTINHRQGDIMADIYAKKPDVLAFSCYIWNWTVVCGLLSDIQKILPNTPIWLGGPEVSFEAEKLLEEHTQLQGIMRGEGEETFLDLLRYYTGEQSITLLDIPGITFRHGGEVIANQDRKPADFSGLPFIYKELDTFQNRIIYYESSRGCPYRCSYCLSSIDKRVRLRRLELVKEELSFFLKEKVAQVKFIDRTFNCSHEHAIAIWKFIIEHDNQITNFHFEIAADLLNEEELLLLTSMRPGLVQLEIGIQSANQKTLQAINRATDLEKLQTTVKRLIAGENVHVHLDLIAGLPYEEYESFGTSFDFVYGMNPHQLQLGFLKVLKGSPMQERAKEFGIYYTEKPPYEVLYSKWIGYEDICRLKLIEEMVELYYNSNQFTHTLSVLVSNFEHPFAMFEQLAAYFADNGYFVNHPSRAYRYEVLLGFAKTCDSEQEGLYEELLTYDMYLRENLKSRPVFANEQTSYKECIRNFYEDRQKVAAYLPKLAHLEGKQAARMTHMEFFRYPVWEMRQEEQKKRCGEAKAVLFDYDSRDALTAKARTIVFTREEMEGRSKDDKEDKGDS